MDDNTPTDDNSSEFPGLPAPETGGLQGLAGPNDEEPPTDTTGTDGDTPSFSDSDDDAPPSGASSSSKLPSIGSLFKRSWATFQKRVIILLALFIISILLMVVPTGLIMVGGYLASTFIPVSQPISLAVFGLIGISVGMWTMSWGMAALLLAASNETLGIGGALSQSRPKAWGFLWVYFLTTLIMYGAFILFFIPGIIVSVWLIPTIFVFINEDARGMDAVLKAREYVRGHWFAVFVRVLLFVLLYTILSIIPLIGPIIALILIPFYLLYLYTLYEDLKETKGDFDFQPSRKGKLSFGGLAVAGLVLPFVLLYFLVMSNPNSQMMMQMMLGQVMNRGQMQFDMNDLEGMEGFEGFEELDMDDFDFAFDEEFDIEEEVVVETPPPPIKTAPIKEKVKIKVTPPTAPVVKKPKSKPASAPKKVVVAQAQPAPAPATAPVLIGGAEPSTPVTAWHGPQYSVEKNITILADWSLPWIDRNEAARALGEAKDAKAVTPLKRALEEDPEPLVRREAALSLGKIGDTEAVKVLTRAASNDEDEWVGRYAEEALYMIANPGKIKRPTSTAATAPANDWVVNVASYTSQSEANATFDMLSEMDFDPYITEFFLNETLWYRVRVGFFGSRTSANSTKKEIETGLNITDAWSVKAAASELSRH